MKILSNLINKESNTTKETTVKPGNWFTSKEHYFEFVKAFKDYANNPKTRDLLDSHHFILYAILRNKDWTKGWTYPTNPGKQVEHKWKKYYSFNRIESNWYEEGLLKPFDGTVTTEMLKAVRDNLSEIKGEK